MRQVIPRKEAAAQKFRLRVMTRELNRRTLPLTFQVPMRNVHCFVVEYSGSRCSSAARTESCTGSNIDT